MLFSLNQIGFNFPYLPIPRFQIFYGSFKVLCKSIVFSSMPYLKVQMCILDIRKYMLSNFYMTTIFHL